MPLAQDIQTAVFSFFSLALSLLCCVATADPCIRLTYPLHRPEPQGINLIFTRTHIYPQLPPRHTHTHTPHQAQNARGKPRSECFTSAQPATNPPHSPYPTPLPLNHMLIICTECWDNKTLLLLLFIFTDATCLCGLKCTSFGLVSPPQHALLFTRVPTQGKPNQLIAAPSGRRRMEVKTITRRAAFQDRR